MAPPLELRGYIMNRKGARLIALLSAAAFSAAPFAARAQDSLLIKGGTIIPVVGKPIPNGSLLIMNGKIAKLGTGLSAPAGATVIEANLRQSALVNARSMWSLTNRFTAHEVEEIRTFG